MKEQDHKNYTMEEIGSISVFCPCESLASGSAGVGNDLQKETKELKTIPSHKG